MNPLFIIGSVVFSLLAIVFVYLRSDGLWLGVGIVGLTFLWGTVFHKGPKRK